MHPELWPFQTKIYVVLALGIVLGYLFRFMNEN